jgi:hypothetical protein
VRTLAMAPVRLIRALHDDSNPAWDSRETEKHKY